MTLRLAMCGLALVVSWGCDVSGGIDLGLGSDPYAGLGDDPCAPGNARPTGEACVVPAAAIVVDGDTGDWAGIEPVPLSSPCSAPPCDALLAAEVTLARVEDADGEVHLAFRVRLQADAAPASSDPSVWYVVEMWGTADETDALLAGAGGVRFRKNDLYVEPPAGEPAPYGFAWTASGYEGSVPVRYLPFVSGARMRFYAVRVDGEDTVIVSDPPPEAQACWSTRDVVLDLCATVPE